MLPRKIMFHSRDSPRLLVCDTRLYLEHNDIGFITVAICGGYISKIPLTINGSTLPRHTPHNTCQQNWSHCEALYLYLYIYISFIYECLCRCNYVVLLCNSARDSTSWHHIWPIVDSEHVRHYATVGNIHISCRLRMCLSAKENNDEIIKYRPLQWLPPSTRFRYRWYFTYQLHPLARELCAYIITIPMKKQRWVNSSYNKQPQATASSTGAFHPTACKCHWKGLDGTW